jgi:hypothetical protein
MTNVFDVLSEDHEQVRGILSELGKRPRVLAATGADAQQLDHWKKRVEELTAVVSRHETVEETYFWPFVRERHPSGDDLADKGIGQEQADRKALNLLGKLDAAHPGFEDVLASFIRDAREHIFFEEAIVWPALAVVLSMREANELGEKLEQGKRNAPCA